MVQPTRIVFCACAALMLARTDTAAAAAKVHFEAIRIIPAPAVSAPGHRGPLFSNISLSWFKQSGKPLTYRLYSPGHIATMLKDLDTVADRPSQVDACADG